MRSTALPRFWEMYHRLPAAVRRDARKAYAQFERDPTYPSLQFKPLGGYPGYWSVRVTLSYRAVCRRTEDRAVWVWIGSHAEFDRDFR